MEKRYYSRPDKQHLDTVRSTFSSSQFFWDKNTKELHQEVSSLTRGGGNSPFRAEGNQWFVTVVSSKTGQSVNFKLIQVDKDASGEDVYGWRLVPTEESIQHVPACKGVRMLIVND